MPQMPRVKKSKPRRRLERSIRRTRQILEQIVQDGLDPYMGYRELYNLYCHNSGLHESFRILFAIPGIEPDGILRVDDAFRAMIRNMAAQWLREHPVDSVEPR